MAFACEAVSGEVCNKEHQELSWVEPSELKNFDMAPADLPIVERILKERGQLFGHDGGAGQMSNKNSKFGYMYRDASNYKQFGYVIFSGEPTPKDAECVNANLHEGDFFIPGDVDLPSLQEKFGNVDIDDHPWHEIDFGGDPERCPFGLTSESPTDDRSVHQFAQEFEQVSWDEMKASCKMGLI
jgi:hypothetical protein